MAAIPVLKRYMMASLLALTAGAGHAQQLAFPGAEGAGRFAAGGRGGRVIAVTNLNDAGPGSLREAIEAYGPRIIIFRLSGTIALRSPLVITHGRVTIAGQSAPGDGITLRDHVFTIAADDVIVRHIRSRLGAVSRTQEDAFTIIRGRRIMVDHVSASWSVDETLSSSAKYDRDDAGIWDLTVQWSIIADSLRKSVHEKGEHGYGSLIRVAKGAKVSYHHNLWANHLDRMPRPGNYSTPAEDPKGGILEFRSNVFYNWGKERSGYNWDNGTHIAYNFIDNAYVSGPDSKGLFAFEERNPLAHGHFAGNSMNGSIPRDQKELVTGPVSAAYWLAEPLDVAPIAIDPAPRAYARVLQCAGASMERDTVDTRIIAGVRSRQGRIIDNEADDGGWPALRSRPAPIDGDGDGMPDAWEKAHGLDSQREDGSDIKGRDGWSNIELYLNQLASQAAGKTRRTY